MFSKTPCNNGIQASNGTYQNKFLKGFITDILNGISLAGFGIKVEENSTKQLQFQV